jgi:hypothetical protein
LENVPEAVQVNRYEVLEALMDAGVPVSKINRPKLRRKLEEGTTKLVDASHLVNTYLRPLMEMEVVVILEEVGPSFRGLPRRHN